MRSFTVIYAGRDSAEPFANHLYEVGCDGRTVAEIMHDFRGDEHAIRKPGGAWVPIASGAIRGGGPNPVTLTAGGAKAVERLLRG